MPGQLTVSRSYSATAGALPRRSSSRGGRSVSRQPDLRFLRSDSASARVDTVRPPVEAWLPIEPESHLDGGDPDWRSVGCSYLVVVTKVFLVFSVADPLAI